MAAVVTGGIRPATSGADRRVCPQLGHGRIKRAIPKLEQLFLMVIKNTVAKYDRCTLPGLYGLHNRAVADHLRRMQDASGIAKVIDKKVIQQKMCMGRVDATVRVGLPPRIGRLGGRTFACLFLLLGTLPRSRAPSGR